jgi:H+/Cl- antiporter ClcA
MKKHEIHYLDTTRLAFIGKGILVGALVGIVVSLFRLAIERLSEAVVTIYHYLATNPVLLIPWTLLSIIIAIIVIYLVKSEPQIKGSGIPQVEGKLNGEINYPWFSVLWKKFIGGILSVGSGLFLGREGPSIQLGATVGQGLSQYFKAPKSEEKILISSGASAGLSAAFNAPIAGLLFILEEIHHSFSPLVWLTSFASVITANFVSLNFFGLKPVLYQGKISDLPLKYYGALVVLGILLGVLGRFYQWTLLSFPKWYGKLPIPADWHGLVPFLLVIPIGLFLPNFLGGGNQIILTLAETDIPFFFLIMLFLLRYCFSMISYGSGLPGGIFLPILTLGGLLGAIFGTLLAQTVGLDPIYIKNFVIVAMAGYFTAIGKAPLTAIILVTEMVGSINHLMPLGLVSLIAYIVVDGLGGHPIYESLLERMHKQPLANIRGSKTVIEYPVTAESSFDGMAVRDFPWPENMLLVSIRRGENEILTRGDTIMKVGDALLILTDENSVSEVKKKIGYLANGPLT